MAKDKEAYYFSHDSNARNDPKIGAMRCEYGSEGYGWYWMLVEMMREQTGYKLDMQSKYAFRAFSLQLQCDSDVVKKFIEDCINEFELFESDGSSFWSNSLIKRMEKRLEKSRAASESAKGKWKTDERLPNASETPAQTRSNRLSEARKKGSHTKREWEDMKAFFSETCVKCLGTSGLDGVVKDHIIPIYQGGSDSIKNLQPLCARCNASKGPENIDYRIYYCAKKGVTMPEHWTDEHLPNASETPPIKESKVKEIKEKESKEEQQEVVVVNPFKIFESEGFGTISSVVADKMGYLIDDYGERWICEAMKVAVYQGKRKLSYVEGILKSWKTSGIDEPWIDNQGTSISTVNKKHSSSRTEKNMEILKEIFWEEEEREQKGNGPTSSHNQPQLL